MQAILFSLHADEAAVLSAILQQAGMTVRSVRDFARAIEAWPENPAELLLVAASPGQVVPPMQIKQMRAFTVVPIVVIADSLPEDEQVNLMEAGVDLVVIRPYGVRMLLAQIRGLLRRSAGLPFHSLPILTQGEVTLDPSTRTVRVGEGQPTHLTQLEFRLLYTLITHPGQIISAESLVEHVWGYSGEGNRELVRGLVQRLRSKVERDPHHPRYIITEPGVGYYFNRFSVES